jgi:hypothetical protein
MPVTHVSNPSYLRLRSGGLQFQASLDKKVHETSSNRKKLDVVVCAYNLSYGGKCKIGGLQFNPTWAKSEILSPK